MTEFGIVPVRVDAGDQDKARQALAEDGAVVLTGMPATADTPVVAAALLHGARLREVFPLRERTSRDGGPVHLHADSFDVVVDIGGVPTRRRDPDEDTVVIQCVHAPADGGASFLADAYRFADHCDPALAEFLTGADVDLYGAWPGIRGLPATPRVGRHVEYTRTGRRIVRRTDGATALHRDPNVEHVQAMLAHLADTVRAVEATLPRFPLTEGDVLVLDNYRCWHGRDPHTGTRTVRILTLRTTDAR